MKFYDDMPNIEANDNLLIMVGDTTTPNQPKKITFAKIKAYIKANWTISFNDLTAKPKINGVELGATNTLDYLGIQPKGTYVNANTALSELEQIDITKSKNLFLRVKDEDKAVGIEAKIALSSLTGPLAIIDVIDIAYYVITHDMGSDFYPSIRLIDSSKNQETPVVVTYVNDTTISVSWEANVTGKLIIK